MTFRRYLISKPLWWISLPFGSWSIKWRKVNLPSFGIASNVCILQPKVPAPLPVTFSLDYVLDSGKFSLLFFCHAQLLALLLAQVTLQCSLVPCTIPIICKQSLYLSPLGWLLFKCDVCFLQICRLIKNTMFHFYGILKDNLFLRSAFGIIFAYCQSELIWFDSLEIRT